MTQVQFFRGTTSLGIDTSSPYSVSWTNAAAGSYAVKAVATDNAGATGTSALANITVNPVTTPDTTAPSVPAGLSAPSVTSSSVTLTWTASTDNAGGSGIAGYDVYRNGSLVGSPTSVGYTDSGLSAATAYNYRVRARDNAGNASAQGTQISATTSPGGGGGNKRVLGYFAQWGIYGRNYRVKNIDTSGSAAKLTHINYAFGNVRNNICEVGLTIPSNEATGAGGDAFADYSKAFSAAESVSGVADTWDQPLRGNWNQLKQLKAKYPNIKVLISLGGWTWSRGLRQRGAAREPRGVRDLLRRRATSSGNLPVTDSAGGTGRGGRRVRRHRHRLGIPQRLRPQPAAAPKTAPTSPRLLAEFRRQLNLVRPGLLLTIASGRRRRQDRAPPIRGSTHSTWISST